MTEPHDHLADALHGLRGEIRAQLAVPAAAGLRTRAIHRLRVRRATTTVVAVAAAVAVAVGGNSLLQPNAGPPPPPADTPSPAPVTPSPRPAPQNPEPITDPIAQVEWGQATIDIPPREGCPGGPVTFTPVSDVAPNGSGPADGYPQVAIDATYAAYGDLTGDGRFEAVLGASCFTTEEDSGDGQNQLLVVARDPGGDLRGIAWVGPRGALYFSPWVADGALYVEVRAESGADFAWPPGVAWRYQWSGDGFDDPVAAPEYPPILPDGDAETGPAVRLGAVAGGLGCPDRELRFDRDGRASADGITYELYQPTAPRSGPHLMDLDGTGERLLVVAIECTHDDGATRGLAVFEWTGDGFAGISVLRPDRFEIVEWRLPFPHPQQDVDLEASLLSGSGAQRDRSYRWTGTVFEPVEE